MSVPLSCLVECVGVCLTRVGNRAHSSLQETAFAGFVLCLIVSLISGHGRDALRRAGNVSPNCLPLAT